MSHQMYRKIIIGCLFLCLFVSVSYAMGSVPRSEPETASEAFDFTLEDLNGKSHTLSDYKGKIVFLNFWATWCPPCRAEMPSMQKLYQSWDNKKFIMLAVNIRQSRDAVKAFADKNGYAFPILLDLNGKVATRYKVRGIPTTYFIDEKGKVITRVVGGREWTLHEIEELFK